LIREKYRIKELQVKKIMADRYINIFNIQKTNSNWYDKSRRKCP